MLKMKLLPSTEKCFVDEAVEAKYGIDRISMLKNEKLSFQLAYTETDRTRSHAEYGLRITSPLKPYITLYRIEQVPVKLPIYRTVTDPDFLRREPGLYPDLMIPYEKQPRFLFVPGELRSILVTVDGADGIAPGRYPIEICAMRGDEVVCAVTLTLEVIDAMLPGSELIYTCWFHSDCLAEYYNVPVFSEEYWTITRNFVRAAVAYGQNMLLTPVFTPPLDTAVGLERLTVQLVDVAVDKEGNYFFGFDNLDRWIKMAMEEGIEYFEISHLFTQWGCAHAPKIMANTPEGYRRIWGWDTDAHSVEYKAFLRAFLVALIAHMKEIGVDKRCWFHISDEPNIAHMDAYLDAKNAISDLLEGYHIMDALSSFEFYRTGAVETPIPATSHIEPFLEAGVPNLWTYYCCGQSDQVSNRFLAMPGYRTRIIGVQMFKFRIAGFLQWGFNFYHNQGSYYSIDPYAETCGDYFVPAGDAFVVYPAPDKTAYPTLHGLQFAESIQDLRALKLCASRIGWEKTISLVEQGLAEPITFRSYPREHGYLLALRERINAAIKETL